MYSQRVRDSDLFLKPLFQKLLKSRVGCLETCCKQNEVVPLYPLGLRLDKWGDLYTAYCWAAGALLALKPVTVEWDCCDLLLIAVCIQYCSACSGPLDPKTSVHSHWYERQKHLVHQCSSPFLGRIAQKDRRPGICWHPALECREPRMWRLEACSFSESKRKGTRKVFASVRWSVEAIRFQHWYRAVRKLKVVGLARKHLATQREAQLR